MNVVSGVSLDNVPAIHDLFKSYNYYVKMSLNYHYEITVTITI